MWRSKSAIGQTKKSTFLKGIDVMHGIQLFLEDDKGRLEPDPDSRSIVVSRPNGYRVPSQIVIHHRKCSV
jgi:hypothetical protein